MARLIRRVLEKSHGVFGMTLVETMIAVSIATLIVSAIAALQFISARSINDLYRQARMRSVRMITIDQIRYRLMDARIGSLALVNGGRQLQFTDPNLAGAPSAFSFNPTTHVLSYDDNINALPGFQEVSKGIEELTFQLEGPAMSPTRVRIHLKTLTNLAQGRSDAQEGETLVYLRNG